MHEGHRGDEKALAGTCDYDELYKLKVQLFEDVVQNLCRKVG